MTLDEWVDGKYVSLGMRRAKENQQALDELAEKYEDIKRAKSAYTLAINECAERGISNIKMGKVLGITETAVRKWRERHYI